MQQWKSATVKAGLASSGRWLAILGAVVLALALAPNASVAQSCTDCVRYAGVELNLRQQPSLDGVVLRFIPRGAAVELTAGDEQNGYVPVLYDSVPGWAVALGLVATEAEVDEFVLPVGSPSSPVASNDARVTLSALVLRGAPASDAEPILTMPEGAPVTLTREGAENGYVTVDYDGTIGWAYADLLGEAAGGA